MGGADGKQHRLVLVPIPRDALVGTSYLWLPLLDGVSKGTRCPVGQHIDEIQSGAVEIMLAYEPEVNRAHALAGVRHLIRGNDVVAEIVWCSGENREHWFGLIEDIETYQREHHGCVAITAFARPGWSRAMKERGYRVSHIVLERDLDGQKPDDAK